MVAFAVVGTSVPRIEGPEKVTGAALYAADIQLPGLLWCKILRSAEPHARLARVDASNVPVPAAVANAVARACGARVFDLPITAERVRRALRRLSC